ncbi:hypothetical protein Trydic_g14086 [Trypoxylus dichotomus]
MQEEGVNIVNFDAILLLPIVMVFAKCAVHGCGNKRSSRHRFPNPSMRPLVHKNHRVCHVHFHDEDRASKSYLKKNAVPSLFLPVPTVDGKENVSDHEHCTIVAESNAPTPEPNVVESKSVCLLIAVKHQYEQEDPRTKYITWKKIEKLLYIM